MNRLQKQLAKANEVIESHVAINIDNKLCAHLNDLVEYLKEYKGESDE